MCIFCGSKAHVGDVSQLPDLSRRSFVSKAVAFGSLYAGANVSAQVLGSSEAQAQTSAGTADILIENAKIITLDPKAPRANAIAIAGDKIVGVGARRDLSSLVGKSTKIVDAGGRTIIPGLNDAHTHFIRAGLNYSQEVRWDGVPSLSIGLSMLKAQAARTPAPHWVQVVGGWSPWQFSEKRFPTLDEINKATGDVPCFIMHLYDRAFINKAGMRVLGWTKETPDPFGGFISRDGQGNPTGMLIGTSLGLAALLGVFARIPKLQPEDQIQSTKHMMRELNRLGITSLIDAGGGGLNYPDNYATTAKLAADKQLTVRVAYTLMAQRPGQELADYQGWLGKAKLHEGDDYFRLAGAGEYVLWAAGDITNFAKDPSPQPPIMEEKLTEVIKFIAGKGWPFRMHASFDFTAKRILGVLEKVHQEIPLDKLRWGLEHGEGLTQPTLERIAKMGGSLGLQNRMSSDGEAYITKWGKEAAEDAPAFGNIRKMGIPFALGTDGNRAASYNVWVGLQWLVTGRTQGGLKHNADRNLMSREDALRAYSAQGAYISGEEDKKGTLSVGKWADLAVLTEDYLTVPANQISQLSSVLTMVGGKVVYGSGAYAGLAPAAPKVAPDWLPIGHFSSFAKTASADQSDPTGIKYAAVMLQEAMPKVVGADGAEWNAGCGCGLL